MENLEQLKGKFFNKTLSVEEQAKFVELMASDKEFAEDIAIELQLRKALIANNQLSFEIENVEKKKVSTIIKEPTTLTSKRTFLPYYYAAAAIMLIGICILGIIQYKKYQEKQLLSEINKKAQELKNLEATTLSDSLKNAQALADSLNNKKGVDVEKNFTPSVKQEKITNNGSKSKSQLNDSTLPKITLPSPTLLTQKEIIDKLNETINREIKTGVLAPTAGVDTDVTWKILLKKGNAPKALETLKSLVSPNTENMALSYFYGILIVTYGKNSELSEAIVYLNKVKQDPHDDFKDIDEWIKLAQSLQ